MPDLLQALKNMFQSVVDNEPKQPLHIGEAMSCWLYMTMLAEAMVYEEAGANSTTDPELLSTLSEAISFCKEQVDTLTDFMQKEGVPLPPVSERKPHSDPLSVPLGVKLTDDEIANGLSVKYLAAMIHCATAAGQSIRTDVGVMFTRFQMEMLTFGENPEGIDEKTWMDQIPAIFRAPRKPCATIGGIRLEYFNNNRRMRIQFRSNFLAVVIWCVDLYKGGRSYFKLKMPFPVSILIGNDECSCVMIQDSFSLLRPNVNLLVI